MSDDVSRYRENCSLFTTLPVASFENALEHKQPVCSLAGQGVDDNAMVCIAESMRTNDFIKELNLSANAFTSAGAQDLATALAENRTLQTLKLKNNAIGDAGITSIFASVLDNPASALSCVDCSSTGITTMGLPKLMGCIAVNRSLTALNLESCGLTSEAGGALSSALQRADALQVLVVGSNNLGDAGVIAICKGLQLAMESERRSPSLTLLDLSRNGMTVKGAAAIADLLRHRACPLTDMLLAHNKLSPDGCVAIAQAIKEAVSVGDETTHAVYGGRAQAAAFNLRYLDMTGVDAGASGTIALREAAEAASALLASSRDGGLFEIDGLEEIWLPAAPTPRRVPSSSRSDFSGFSLTGPASVVTMPERTDRKPAAAATPSSALAQVMKAVSPVNAMPASSTPASMHVSGSQLARASVPADEATTLLIELLHRQLEDQSQQIAELRGVVFRQPVARSRRSSTPTMDATAYGTEADTSKSRIGRLLASVAARGATESSSEHAPMSTSKRTTPDTTDWGVHSTALAASSTKRLQAVEDAVLELGNEIRWIDEEGVRARLDAEAVTRTRMDALAARVDAIEDGGPLSKRTDTGSARRANAGPNTPGSHHSDAAVPRDTLVKHVRINEERLVSLHGDVQSLRVHSSAIEELLTTLTIRVEALEAGSSGAQSTTSVSALASKMDSHVRALSARIDELSSDTKPRRASAAAQGPLVHLTMDELNEIISRAVSNQVAAVTSKMKSDVDAAVGASLQTLQRSLDTRQPAVKSDVHDKLAALTARLNVLEEAITADQEQSLSTLEAIMRITKRNGVSVSQDVDESSPSSGVRAVSPHLLYASGRLPGAPLRPAASTGILSVKVTPQ